MAAIATAICWGVVIVVWIAGAVDAARSRGSRQGTDRPLWTIGLLAVAIVLMRLSWHDARKVTDHAWWIELPGLVLLVVSTVFTIWARVRLGRMWSASPDVLQAHHVLRTDGPYAITRHPIYTGLLGMLVGTVLLNGLGVSLSFLPIAAVFLALRIPVEERLMSQTFPAEYARYRERVPRLVPRIHLHRRAH